MNIVVKPSTVEEFLFVEELLKKMKIPFQSKSIDVFTKEQVASIEKGIEQVEKGDFVSSKEVQEKARALCGL